MPASQVWLLLKPLQLGLSMQPYSWVKSLQLGLSGHCRWV